MASMMSNELAMRFRFFRNISRLFEDSRPLRALLRPFSAVDGAIKNMLRKRSMSFRSVHASNVVVPDTTTTVVSGNALEKEATTSDERGDVGVEREGIESAYASGYLPARCACANSTSGTICLMRSYVGHHHHHHHHNHNHNRRLFAPHFDDENIDLMTHNMGNSRNENIDLMTQTMAW
jgi:hypothetical protein